MESERESLLPNSSSSPAMATKTLSSSTTLASTFSMAASSTTVASSATLASPLLGGTSSLALPAVTSTPLLASSSTVVERDELEEERLEEVVKVNIRQGSGHSVGERSLPHSESRQSLQGKQVAAKSRQVRRQKSAQLPAHGEVQRMEQSLLRLLHQFNSGQLRAFDRSMLVQMEQVRDQQEAIARRHFELGAEQDLHPPLSDDGLTMACENMGQLMSSLETLSLAIGQLSSLDRLGEGRGAFSQPEGREGSTMSSEPLYTRRF